MPTVITHAVAGCAIGRTALRGKIPWRFWPAAMVCAMLPDADVIGFRFGIAYGDVLGHRGFSHSLVFAAVLGLLASRWVAPHARRWSKGWWGWWALMAGITASHGILDAMTDGGLGVAFFSPFSNHRYFFGFRPIQVSPIGLSRFLSARGLNVLIIEIVWVWLPCLGMMWLATRLRRRRSR